MSEVEEIEIAPLRAIHQANAAQDDLIKLHANGLRLMALEDAPQAAQVYQQASEALDERLQSILFDERGRPRLVPDEMQRQRDLVEQERASHLETFRTRLAHLQEVVDETEQHATARLAAMSRPVLDLLSGADLERASHRRAFVAEDCEQLGIRDFIARIDATIAGGDTVDRALYQRYGAQRLERERADPGHAPGSPIVAQLAAAMSRLDAKLTDPATLAKREKYMAQQAAAERLRQAISAARFSFDPAAIADRARRWGI